MSRPIIAHIALDAFRHNYREAKRLQGGRALAVIKANAYGHGAVRCAKAIADEADGFAVATLGEAIQLRQTGIKAPILLLEGFFTAAELPEIVVNDCWVVIHAAWQVQILCAAKLAQPLQVWLKMDSGMHRLGFAPNDYLNVFTQLSQHCNVKKIVLMSHFANADVLDSNHTVQQLRVFQEAVASIPQVEMSLANSAAILAWQEAQRALYLKVARDVDQQWSRPGIMLYGANPLPSSTHLLQPVMQLRSKIIAIQTVQAGASIGYGSLFTAKRNTKVGVVACGYADGYPRSAMDAPVAVDGMMTQLIGRVSMDMLFVDLTDLPLASIGSVVELWGEKVSVNAVAKAAGTIAYELLCNVKRVEFRYTDAATLI